MSFSRALFNHVKTLMTGAGITEGLAYGTAEGFAPPYYVMLKVSDPEQSSVLCELQNTAGDAQYQFSYVSERTAAFAEITLDVLKNLLGDIYGDIVYDSTTYSVWNNVTSGVTPLGGSLLNTWDAIVTTTLSWSRR